MGKGVTKACSGICHASGSFKSSLNRRKVLESLRYWPWGGKSTDARRYASLGENMSSKKWEKYEDVAVYLLNNFASEFGLDGFDGKLKTSKWAKITKCSADTALRDVKDLIDKGVLKQEESGGRSTNYELILE